MSLVFNPKAQSVLTVVLETKKGPKRGWGKGWEMSPSPNPRAQPVLLVVLKNGCKDQGWVVVMKTTIMMVRDHDVNCINDDA